MQSYKNCTRRMGEKNHKMESLITYFIVMSLMFFLFYSYFPICNKFQNRKRIYKRLLAIPYGEAILAMCLFCFLFTSDFESDGLFFLSLIFLLLPFVHIFVYYCIPYYKTKIPRNKAFQLIAFILGYVAIIAVLCSVAPR